jgi:beta-ureidopropionase / N-carbamoyl-L-amino-acid hydrolase
MTGTDQTGMSPSFPRLRARLDALAELGALDGGGCSRLALTDADRAGRDLVVTWMHDLGARVDIDAIGNVTATWPADRFDPPVMIGSHIDTVATGGIYDGCLGVLAGVEVLETLIAGNVATERPVAVTFFTDEEGARFHPDMLGSLVYAGGLAVEDALSTVGVDGAVLGEELQRIGYAGSAPCPGRAPHAYVELHIEQGPVLEAEGVQIGAVTGVQGISWTEVTVTGQSNHAGTTPMAMRHDAALVAAQVAVFVRDLTREMGAPLVGTVGRVALHPNLVNVVAARATFTIDLRHTDRDTLHAAVARVRAHCEEVAAAEGATVVLRTLADFDPVAFDDGIVTLVEDTARALGCSVQRMPSGAGHDAQMLARLCPAGMVFVPSARGISHNPAEHTDDADLARGASVLFAVVRALAGAS